MNEDGKKLGWTDERVQRFRISMLYVVRHQIRITMGGMARTADEGVYRSPTASSTSAVVDTFKVRTIRTFLAFVHELVAKKGRYISDRNLRLDFVITEYLKRNIFRLQRILIW